MSTPCFGEILGIDLRAGRDDGLLYVTVGDEVETMASADEADDGIRIVERIEIADAWVLVHTHASPSLALPLADVTKVWLK